MRPVVYTATATDVANGFTPPIPVDYLRVNGQYSLQYLAAGAAGAGAGNAQYSFDNPFTPPSTGMTWTNVALNAAGRASIDIAVSAFRIINPVLGDVLTVLAQGGSPGV